MNTHRLENISFYNSDIDDFMKIIKIKGGFSCSEEKAWEILDIINTNQPMEVEGNFYSRLLGYGITCDMLSLEGIKRREEAAIQRKKEEEEFEIQKNLADLWFNNLSKTEQEYVKILGQTKFFVTAVG
jgi:hypothetical protein